MEVRLEDNLVLSDGEIVAACIWETCDHVPEIEGYADAFLKRLGERSDSMHDYELESEREKKEFFNYGK